MTSFIRVQAILDGLIAEWSKVNERNPHLRVHGENFGWRTKDELLQSRAFGKRLITPENIEDKAGADSSLVVALRTGVSPYPRMPYGGPYISFLELEEIIDWINTGAQD